jgi:NADH-quinone oxidoreductase subunit K
MTVDAERYLAVAAMLFVLGAIGFLTRRNLILMVLSAEMMLHGVALTLVTFSRVHHNLDGQVFTVFVLTVAACEAGLALALILALYQKSASLDVDVWTNLREADFLPPKSDDRAAAQLMEFEEEEPLPKLAPAGLEPELRGIPDADFVMPRIPDNEAELEEYNLPSAR